MRLFGTQDWDAAQVKRAIDFERAAARALPKLLASMASASDYADPELYAQLVPSDGPFALARAAELAFVTDQFQLGVEICIELLEAPYAQPKTIMQVVQWATIGVALGRMRVTLDASGAKISAPLGPKREWSGDTLPISWPQAATHARYFAQRLIPAAVASGNAAETIEPLLFGSEVLSQAAASMIEVTDEFIAAFSLDGRLVGREGAFRSAEGSSPEIDLGKMQSRTFEGLESAYGRRLDVMRRTPMWKMLRVRGNLIDWSLLLLWIARLRRNGMAPPPGLQLGDIDFVHDLATRLIKRENAG